MLRSDMEYVLLRLIRRLLLPPILLRRFGKYLPYWQPSANETDPCMIVDRYQAALLLLDRAFITNRVVELGVGATNSTAYEIAARGAVRVTGVEPYAPLAVTRDRALCLTAAGRAGTTTEALQARVLRTGDPSAIPDATADLVVSHSVLEHVRDIDRLFAETGRILAPGGVAVHLVDYRDHFFKYPYHFLQFSKNTWDRFLDPGDLPRWRLGDHRRLAAAAGLHMQVLHQERDEKAFSAIRSRLCADFDPADPDMAVTQCTFALRTDPWPQGGIG